MPVTIDELQVTVTVNSPESTPSAPIAAAGANEMDKKAIIDHCLEQVMEIMNKKNER